jgi:hypothetical protein
LIGLNFFLISLPLTNSLGFEFAVANSILLFIIGGFSTATYFKTSEAKISSYYKNGWKHILPLILIPFAIGFLSSIIASRCPIKDGLGFYIVITIPSLVFGNLTGSISTLLNKKFSKTVFFILFLSYLFVVVVEFYFNPQIYFYNPIFGFFPGTIYDEDVAVNLRLIFSQLYNLFFISGIYFLLKFLKKKYSYRLLPFFSFCIMIIVSVLAKPLFGFSTDTWKMNREFKNKIVTQHFIIRFGKDISRSEQDFISLLHEYYYDQITNKLNVRLDERISSYIYSNQTQKRDLFGAGNANVAKPWLNQIYLNRGNYQLALKHEISHIAAAKFGYSILKVADGFNAAMIEGLAMFVEDDFDDYPVSYAAKLAYATEHKVDIAHLFTGMNFFTSYSTLAYIYSGAFFNFLNEEYGIEKLKDIYWNSDWNKIYGEDLHALVERFEKTLKINKEVFNPNSAQLYFGGQTIFKKFCARMASNDIKEADDFMIAKKYARAENLYRNIYGYSNSYSALSGIVASLNSRKKYSSSINLLGREIYKFVKSQAYYNIEIQLADAYAFSNDTLNAMKEYDSVIIQSPHINYTNQVKIRKLIIRKFGSDSLRSFYNFKREKRLELLLKLNREELLYFTIPSIIGIAATKYNLTEWLSNQSSKFVVSNYESYIASIDISKYYMKINDYTKAKNYAIKALDYKTSRDESYKAVENLRMVNWFCSFAEEIRKSFKYTQ